MGLIRASQLMPGANQLPVFFILDHSLFSFEWHAMLVEPILTGENTILNHPSTARKRIPHQSIGSE
jgi:hypothetical protein